jgi:hypothetical protein
MEGVPRELRGEASANSANWACVSAALEAIGPVASSDWSWA